MASKYVDPTAVMQVIGCVFQTPQLLDFTDKYTITEQDFVERFHTIIFGAIKNLYLEGVKTITALEIYQRLTIIETTKDNTVFKIMNLSY